MNPARSIDEVLALYQRFGGDRYDEELSQIDHALQTAALASAEGADAPLVAAALLHDVGHLLALAAGAVAPGAGGAVDEDLRHEAVGARYLARILPPATTGPIALHVRAKRYLCATDADALGRLSAGSASSLARQGGPLSPDEVVAFERTVGFDAAVALRRWDDLGKIEDIDVAPIDAYLVLLDEVATSA